jgi:hypothetical protein
MCFRFLSRFPAFFFLLGFEDVGVFGTGVRQGEGGRVEPLRHGPRDELAVLDVGGDIVAARRRRVTRVHGVVGE